MLKARLPMTFDMGCYIAKILKFWISEYVWLFLTISGFVWVFLGISGYFWLFLAKSG